MKTELNYRYERDITTAEKRAVLEHLAILPGMTCPEATTLDSEGFPWLDGEIVSGIQARRERAAGILADIAAKVLVKCCDWASETSGKTGEVIATQECLDIARKALQDFTVWLLSTNGKCLLRADIELPISQVAVASFKRFVKSNRAVKRSDSQSTAKRAQPKNAPLSARTIRHKKRQYSPGRTADYYNADGSPEYVAGCTHSLDENLCRLWREDFPSEVKAVRDEWDSAELERQEYERIQGFDIVGDLMHDVRKAILA